MFAINSKCKGKPLVSFEGLKIISFYFICIIESLLEMPYGEQILGALENNREILEATALLSEKGGSGRAEKKWNDKGDVLEVELTRLDA